MNSVYDQLGVKTAINAAGTLTRLGGSLMDPEVTAAMADAAGAFVRIDQLHAAVGARIAELTGAEAALVTSGAAAAVTLAAAATLARLDRAKMDRLPDTSSMPCEIIIPRSHRNGYDHALRAAGARLVEVGLAERTRDPQPWEIEAAISDATVAIAFAADFSPLALDEVVEVARSHRLPVIVDAAAALPPKSNLRAFISAGADLVCFSGGKAIRGPQSTGILCGRRPLIASAALQTWDLDYLPEFWDPPATYVDRDYAAGGVPNHGLGRGFKVGKEEIIGLWKALERFVAQDETALAERLAQLSRNMTAGLVELTGVEVALVDRGDLWPSVQLTIDPRTAAKTADELIRRLAAGDPAIHVIQAEARQGRVGIDPFGLQPGDDELIVARIRSLLG